MTNDYDFMDKVVISLFIIFGISAGFSLPMALAAIAFSFWLSVEYNSEEKRNASKTW